MKLAINYQKGTRLTADDIHIRDPFVFIEGGVYYLLGTTGDDPWVTGSNFTLYRSNDLKNFECMGQMVEESTLSDYTQLWAPELHFYEGKYYLIVSVFCKEKGRGSMILTSSSLTEPFYPLTGEYITPAGWGCLDATLFVWKNEPYLIFSNEWTTPVCGNGDGALFLSKLSPDLKTLVGEPRKIVSGRECGFAVEIANAEARGYIAEGPYLVEEDGYIAMYWSTCTVDGYCVVKSVAKDISSEFVFERFIFRKDGGHGMIFRDFEGVQKITFHQPNVTPNERMKVFNLSDL